MTIRNDLRRHWRSFVMALFDEPRRPI